MRGDIPDAAQRLMAELPVRTHVRDEILYSPHAGTPPAATTEKRRSRIRELHAAGWSAAEIARDLHVSSNAIRKSLRVLGLA